LKKVAESENNTNRRAVNLPKGKKAMKDEHVTSSEEVEDHNAAFRDYYENDYGKRKLELVKQMAEERTQRSLELTEALTPQR
jgi:hypothetical protein